MQFLFVCVMRICPKKGFTDGYIVICFCETTHLFKIYSFFGTKLTSAQIKRGTNFKTRDNDIARQVGYTTSDVYIKVLINSYRKHI